MELLEFHGLTVTLERKAIRRLYLRVLPPDGRVQISAPLQMPQTEILNFLEQKESWVRRQKEKFSEQPPAPLEYLPGEKIPLWGTEYPLQIVPGKSCHAEQVGTVIRITAPENSTAAQRQAAVEDLYRRELCRMIPDLLAEREYQIGVRCKEWHVKKMRTKWGTCNVQCARIWLSLYLAEYSVECLDYVITHELVHLLEVHHNARFYQLMDRFEPEWPQIRAHLNGKRAYQ